MRIPIRLFLIFVISFSATFVFAQQGCKVLLENIQSRYDGDCRNNLAHGKGTASGIDTYTGSFRKGYPNGKGIYKWSTGEYYEGEWLMGKREGLGEYHYSINGKEALQTGVWENDRFLGPAPVLPEIKLRQNISDVKISKTGDGNQVLIKIMMAGSNNTSISDLVLTANSGSEFRYGGYMGYESIVFPFICKLTYTTPNMLRTSENHCALEFKISEPGRWEVKLENN